MIATLLMGLFVLNWMVLAYALSQLMHAKISVFNLTPFLLITALALVATAGEGRVLGQEYHVRYWIEAFKRKESSIDL